MINPKIVIIYFVSVSVGEEEKSFQTLSPGVRCSENEGNDVANARKTLFFNFGPLWIRERGRTYVGPAYMSGLPRHLPGVKFINRLFFHSDEEVKKAGAFLLLASFSTLL